MLYMTGPSARCLKASSQILGSTSQPKSNWWCRSRTRRTRTGCMLGLRAAVMETPVGQVSGSPSPSDPSASKYIGIIYDPKLSGEANHRPQLRVPPLRYECLKRLIELARSRFGAVVGDDIPQGDLYFFV